MLNQKIKQLQSQSITEAQKAAARAIAIQQIHKASQTEDLAVITAQLGQYDQWPVRIQKKAGEYFLVSGRSSGMDVYLFKTNAGYLVAVTNSTYNRAGHVPADCGTMDIQEYLQLDNVVDATSLAAAVKWLIENGYAIKLSN